MENGRTLLCRVLPVVIVVIGLWWISSLFSSPAVGEEVLRPDVIRIETVSKLKPLEMPPAVFLHDQHTQAMRKQGKDCTVCHEAGDNRFSVIAGLKNAKDIEQAYHKACIGCHTDQANRGPRDGECRQCHLEKATPVLHQASVHMDRLMHYLHVSSKSITYTGSVANPDGVNCGVCHHVYDEQTKQRVWKPGAEAACSTCHQKEAQGHIPALQIAVHKQCVTCHVNIGKERDKPAKTAHPIEFKESRISVDEKAVLLQPAIWTKESGLPIIQVKLAPGQLAGPNDSSGVTSYTQDQIIPPLTIQPKVTLPQQKIPAPTMHPQSRTLGSVMQKQSAEEVALNRQAAEEAATIEAKILTGPTTCAGCHTLEAQSQWHKVTNAPRLMRGQPNATILVPIASDGSIKPSPDGKLGGLAPVFFNHAKHEAVTENCSTCHHKQISACTDCHTVEGKPEGQFKTLSDISHKKCVSCHQDYIMQKTECAGCHTSLNKPLEVSSSCTVCHQPLESLGSDVQITAGTPIDKKALAKIGEAVLAAHMVKDSLAPQRAMNLDELDIPNEVKIDVLSNKYDPSILPHRKIIESLQKDMNQHSLAETFHSSTLATCAACHHHSPIETLNRPPKCVSCHSAQADKLEVTENRPSLKAAYHQQCMNCHQFMKLAKPIATDCTACHAQKASR